jgi:hypothetical protein
VEAMVKKKGCFSNVDDDDDDDDDVNSLEYFLLV